MIDRDEQATEISAERPSIEQHHLDQHRNSASSSPRDDQQVRQDVGNVLAILEVGSGHKQSQTFVGGNIRIGGSQLQQVGTTNSDEDESEKVSVCQLQEPKVLPTTRRTGNLLTGCQTIKRDNGEQCSSSSSSLALVGDFGSVRSGSSCDMAGARSRAPEPQLRETGNSKDQFKIDLCQKNQNMNSSSGDDERQQQQRSGAKLYQSDSERRYRPQKYCSVCGDKAIACNFNAVTCESCKAFFRRNAFKEQRLRCLFDNCCVIDRVTRRFCSKCRLLKCLQIGMKREWILTDEQKQIKRVKIMQNKQSRQQQQVSTTNATAQGNCFDELVNESRRTSSNDANCQANQQAASEPPSPSLGDNHSSNGRTTRDVSVSCPDEADLVSGLILPYCSLSHQCQFCSLRLNPTPNLGPHQFHSHYQPTSAHHHHQHQLAPSQFHQQPHHLHPPHHHYHYQASHSIQPSSMYTGQQPAPPPPALHHHHQLNYALGPGAPAGPAGCNQMGAIQSQSQNNNNNNEPTLVHPHQYHYGAHAGRNVIGAVVPTTPPVHHSGGSNQDCCCAATGNTVAKSTSTAATSTASGRTQVVENGTSGQAQAMTNSAAAASRVANLHMSETVQPKGAAPLAMSHSGGDGSSQPDQETAAAAAAAACSLTERTKHSETTAASRENDSNVVPMDSEAVVELDESKEPNGTLVSAEATDESETSCTETTVATTPNDASRQQQQQSFEVSEENLVNWNGELFVEPVTREQEIWARVDQLDFSDTERQLIFEMITATKPIFDVNNKPPNDTSFEDIVFFCDLALKSLIKTVKKISAFRILSMDDQIILLKNACFKILLLRSCLFYNDELEGWIDKYGSVKYLKSMKSEKCNNYERHKELLEKLTRPLRRDHLVISFLMMVVLFDSTITLRTANSIALDNLVYLCTLRKYLICTQPDPLAKYERLAEALRILNACNEEYNLFFSRKYQPEQITPLLIEIFDISVNDSTR